MNRIRSAAVALHAACQQEPLLTKLLWADLAIDAAFTFGLILWVVTR